MKITLNQIVKVRLNDIGRAEVHKLNQQISEYCLTRTGNMINFPPQHEDADGYSTWALWDLMQTFGHLVSSSGELPFDIELELTNITTDHKLKLSSSSLYLLIFDTPPDNSEIRRSLECFEASDIEASDIDTGDAPNSIEFRLPNNFNPDRTSWQAFLTESGCNLNQSSLPS